MAIEVSSTEDSRPEGSNRRSRPCRELREGSLFLIASESNQARDSTTSKRRTFVQHPKDARSKRWRDAVSHSLYATAVECLTTRPPSTLQNSERQGGCSMTSPTQIYSWQEKTIPNQSHHL